MSLRHAILGFLSIEPTSGYTLLQRFKGSVGSFWTATQSQIYRELHALEAEGHARVEVIPRDGKPARKVYALTKKGLRELQLWLEQPPEPKQLRDPLLLRLVFAADVEPRAFDAMLASYGASLRETLADYQERRTSPAIFTLARTDRERALWELSIDNGIAWCTAQLEWLEEARRRLAKTPARRTTKRVAGSRRRTS